MFDANRFKRDIKEWVRCNPNGTLLEFADYCEDLIPPNQFSANKWLIEQSLDWYRYILSSRELVRRQNMMVEEECS